MSVEGWLLVYMSCIVWEACICLDWERRRVANMILFEDLVRCFSGLLGREKCCFGDGSILFRI